MSISTERATELAEVATSARENSYVPYSDFKTGAAVLAEDGAIYQGVLVENLVFGLAMCAERVALFSAIAQGSGKPVALAVAAPNTAGDVTFPCGSCLQVAVELGGPDLEIIAVDPETGEPTSKTIQELAPGIPRRKNPGAGEF